MAETLLLTLIFPHNLSLMVQDSTFYINFLSPNRYSLHKGPILVGLPLFKSVTVVYFFSQPAKRSKMAPSLISVDESPCNDIHGFSNGVKSIQKVSAWQEASPAAGDFRSQSSIRPTWFESTSSV